MKVHALPIITLILTSSSVQAQNGFEPTMNPMAYMNPATMMAPMNAMVPMMAAPMGYMNPNAMMAPVSAMAPMVAAPMGMTNPNALMYLMATMTPMISAVMGMMNQATMMNPMTMMPMPQQVPVPSYGVLAYGMPATSAPGAYMPFFPAMPTPQPVTSSQAPAPNMFDPSAWMKMFPNSVPPAITASAAPASITGPGPAVPAVAHKQVKKTHHPRPHHHTTTKSDKPVESK